MNTYKDFDLFTRALVNSRDVDPTYPVLNSIIKHFDFEPEWFAFVYVGFYSIETAIKMCKIMPTKDDWKPVVFKQKRNDGLLTKFGHERRGTARNIDVQIKMFDEIVDFIKGINMIQMGVVGDPPDLDNNEEFRAAIATLPQHSTWACFKLAEVFEKALGYKHFQIKDLGIEGKDPNSSDGTVAGLRLLTGGKDLNFDKSWYSIWNKFGVELAKAYKYDVGEVETSFCKFNKMTEGKYYVGHDIDEFYELEHILGGDYDKIMSKHFDVQLWNHGKGLQKELKNKYSTEGYIYNCHFALTTKSVDVREVLLSIL